MTKKRKANGGGSNDRSRLPWCWYCDREFEDAKVLIVHQKAKHFKCPHCHKKLNSPSGLVIHVAQVHKETMARVPNAIAEHDTPEVEIFGVEGIPPEDLARHYEGLPPVPYKRLKVSEGGLLPLLAAQKANVPSEAERASLQATYGSATGSSTQVSPSPSYPMYVPPPMASPPGLVSAQSNLASSTTPPAAPIITTLSSSTLPAPPASNPYYMGMPQYYGGMPYGGYNYPPNMPYGYGYPSNMGMMNYPYPPIANLAYAAPPSAFSHAMQPPSSPSSAINTTNQGVPAQPASVEPQQVSADPARPPPTKGTDAKAIDSQGYARVENNRIIIPPASDPTTNKLIPGSIIIYSTIEESIEEYRSSLPRYLYRQP